MDVCVTMMDAGARPPPLLSPSNIGEYIKHQTVDNNKEEDRLFLEHFLGRGQSYAACAPSAVLLIYAVCCADVSRVSNIVGSFSYYCCYNYYSQWQLRGGGIFRSY